jgi:hypothetical protein
MSKITFVVEYGDSVSGDQAQGVKIELDDTRNLDDEGEVKSQFYPGDQVYFLVSYPDELRIDRVAATAGMIVAEGDQGRVREQELLFTDEEPVSLGYQPAGAVVPAWQGNIGSSWQVQDGQVTVAGGYPCLARVSYAVDFSGYRLIPPPLSLAEDETYTIYCVVYMEAADD